MTQLFRRLDRIARVARILLFFIFLTASPANAQPQLLIIGNQHDDYEALTQTDIANIFKRAVRISSDGTLYRPVNLPVTNPLRQAVSLGLFKQTPAQMERYWNEQYFQGVSPPFVFESVEAILIFVEDTPGALGYILDCQLNNRVKVLASLSIATGHHAVDDLCQAH